MSKQDNGFSRRQMSELTTGLRLKRSMLFGIAVLVMGASLFFTPSTSAHNIDVEKARELVRDYARRVRDESGGQYIHYSTSCTRSNPGHNHYVGCVVKYQNEADAAKGVYTCKEALVLFMSPHNRDGSYDFEIFMKHESRNYCGKRWIYDEPVS